jgi:hypothetical protein
MASYSLRNPFTLEDAKALNGKTADITYEPNEDEAQVAADATVRSVYEKPGTGRGYLEVSFPAFGPTMIMPFGDVRAVENIREQ